MDIEDSIKTRFINGMKLDKDTVFIRPGGCLATEFTNPTNNKKELIIMIELIENHENEKNDTFLPKFDKKFINKSMNIANNSLSLLPDNIRGATTRFLMYQGAKLNEKIGEKSNHSKENWSQSQLQTVEKDIRTLILTKFGIPIYDILILEPRSILKTSSGKIRRNMTINHLIEGELNDKIIFSKKMAEYQQFK
jgi:hypothetical protein